MLGAWYTAARFSPARGWYAPAELAAPSFLWDTNTGSLLCTLAFLALAGTATGALSPGTSPPPAPALR